MELTRQERDKFAAWCEQRAQENEALSAQMRKLPCTEFVQIHQRQETLALVAVAMLLTGIHGETIEATKPNGEDGA